MHEAKGCTTTDPSILNWTFPAWEGDVTEPLSPHTFYEATRFTLTYHDRTWSVSNGAHLGGGTHFITITEGQYPGYYDVFEHVFDAMAASFEGFPVAV